MSGLGGLVEAYFRNRSAKPRAQHKYDALHNVEHTSEGVKAHLTRGVERRQGRADYKQEELVWSSVVNYRHLCQRKDWSLTLREQ